MSAEYGTFGAGDILWAAGMFGGKHTLPFVASEGNVAGKVSRPGKENLQEQVLHPQNERYKGRCRGGHCGANVRFLLVSLCTFEMLRKKGRT